MSRATSKGKKETTQSGSKITDAWKISRMSERDYEDIRTAYRLASFDLALQGNPVFARRNLIVGHENFDEWINGALSSEKTALISGFGASGTPHLGSLYAFREIAYYQEKYGAKAFLPISDLEAISVRNTDQEKIRSLAFEFVAHMIAAGINTSSSEIYLQGSKSEVLKLTADIGREFDLRELMRLYGKDMTFGEAYASFATVADILYPQTIGFKNTSVILGIDEIDHFVLAKSIIKSAGPRFIQPAITYSKHIWGLQESKMGKSLSSENNILLSDTPDTAAKKLGSLDPKKFELETNPAFSILMWFAEDDQVISRLASEANKKVANAMAIEEATNVVGRLLTEHKIAYDEALETIRRSGIADLIRES